MRWRHFVFQLRVHLLTVSASFRGRELTRTRIPVREVVEHAFASTPDLVKSYILRSAKLEQSDGGSIRPLRNLVPCPYIVC